MLCEACGKNPATFFYKQTKNGCTVEKNLCSQCAKKQGLNIPSGLFPFGELSGDDFFGNFLGSFLDEKPQIVSSETCPKCGMTLAELFHNGKVGCDNCYSFFRRSLMPTVTKIHGNVRHCGKRPCVPTGTVESQEASNEKPSETPAIADSGLNELKEKLRLAIEKQEYEDAAKYRDEIRAIERKNNERGE